mgnify:CR=1 FL=1
MRVGNPGNDMTKLYVYSNETGQHIATICGESGEACEQLAQELGYGNDDYPYTYSPAFGFVDGLAYNADAPAVVVGEQEA